MNLKKYLFAVLISLSMFVGHAYALTSDQKIRLIKGDNELRIGALSKVAESSDIEAMPYIQAISNDQVKIKGNQVFIVNDSDVIDAMTGKTVELPDDAEDVVNNNQMRGELDATISALNLFSKEAKVRLEAAKALLDADPSAGRLVLIKKAEQQETDTAVKQVLFQVRAAIEITSEDKVVRLAAAKELGESANPGNKQILSSRLGPDGEKDQEVVAEIKHSLTLIKGHMALYDKLGQIFTGISLGSILLLAALGLAVTYGLMGVINMAHGEMMMIGAYATFVIQNLFHHYLPSAFNWYLLAAIPFAFVVTALVGIIIERLVLRHLYGRPLETLLATWGVSLMLMQLVRTIFGAQNVEVENPVWMSGGVELATNLILPNNRIYIIAFAVFVLFAMWMLITKTRLGLFIRAVTQNRAMASCTGVNTRKVDAMAFGLGSGIAGLAGVALSQIGNVGPALGQGYIVDSFMVVVLGGVGQLAGAVYAAMGLGIVSKFLEGIAGAVLAKIFVLVIIIIFIQKRPQGLFAFKGRSID
jgi:urea transport system permease protein